MSVVVGIDPSLRRTGIAILVDGTPHTLNSVGFGTKDGASHRDRNRRIRAVCSSVTKLIDNTGLTIDLVLIEDQLEHGPMLPSALDRSGLWNGIFGAIDARKIPIAVVNTMTLKTWATGKTRPSGGTSDQDKRFILATVRDWWPAHTVRNHDIADAAVMAAMGAHRLGDPLPFELRPRHDSGLNSVHWPEELAA